MGEHRSYSGSSMNSIVHQATYGHTWNQGQCGSTFRINFLVRYKRKDQIKSINVPWSSAPGYILPKWLKNSWPHAIRFGAPTGDHARRKAPMADGMKKSYCVNRVRHGNPWVSLGKWSTHFGGSYEPLIATAYLAPFLKTFRVSSFKRHWCLLLLFNFTQRPLKIPSLRFWSRHGWCWLPWHGVEETCGSLQCLVG